MLFPPCCQTLFCTATSTQEPGLRGRADFHICSMRSSEMSKENSCMHGYAKGMDSMPSPPTELGTGLACGGRDCKLTWILTLEDDFLLRERCKESTTVFAQPQAPALARESRQHAPFSLPSPRYGRLLALDMGVRPCCLLHPSFRCLLQEAPHFRKWSHGKTAPVTI